MEDTIAKREIDIKDDTRQALIVGRYEIIKFFNGKKIYIYGIIYALVLALLSVVLFFFTDGDPTTESILSGYVSFITLLMLIGATLFSSVTLVSEFEERTSLLLFTRPIRKGSIFMGKFLAALFLNLAFVVLYYLLSAVIVGIKTGGFTGSMFASMGFSAAYVFALTGIAILFSALMKKSSSASILTFVFILLVPSIVAMIIMLATGSQDLSGYWYILDVASVSITNSISGTVENGVRDFFVMLVWGLVPAIGSYFLFRNREV